MWLGYRNHQLFFDFLGLGLLLATFVVLAVAACHIRRRRRVAGLLCVFALVLASGQVYRGTMVSQQAWLTMLGAVQMEDGMDRPTRLAALRRIWHPDFGTARAADWYVLARSWDVCHDLWSQARCTRPVPSEPAVGVARELLHELLTRPERTATVPQ
jgi:hypothetical protein